MAFDYGIAVRCRVVVQEAARVFSPSRMAWSAWMVACLAICSFRYVLLLVRATRLYHMSGAYFLSIDLFLGELTSYFTGSVSVGVWQIACRRLIVVGEKAVKSFAGKLISVPLRSSSVKHGLLAPSYLDPKNDNINISLLAPTPNNTPRKNEKNGERGTS